MESEADGRAVQSNPSSDAEYLGTVGRLYFQAAGKSTKTFEHWRRRRIKVLGRMDMDVRCRKTRNNCYLPIRTRTRTHTHTYIPTHPKAKYQVFISRLSMVLATNKCRTLSPPSLLLFCPAGIACSFFLLFPLSSLPLHQPYLAREYLKVVAGLPSAPCTCVCVCSWGREV